MSLTNKHRELMNLIESGIRGYTAQTWKTLWQKRSILATRDEILTAIEELGQSREEEILQFLEKIYEPSVSIQRRSASTLQGVDVYNDEWDVEYYDYPFAPDILRHRLQYEIELTCGYCCAEYPRSEVDIEKDRAAGLPSYERAHQVLEKAIANLRRAVL